MDWTWVQQLEGIYQTDGNNLDTMMTQARAGTLSTLQVTHTPQARGVVATYSEPRHDVYENAGVMTECEHTITWTYDFEALTVDNTSTSTCANGKSGWSRWTVVPVDKRPVKPQDTTGAKTLVDRYAEATLTGKQAARAFGVKGTGRTSCFENWDQSFNCYTSLATPNPLRHSMPSSIGAEVWDTAKKAAKEFSTRVKNNTVRNSRWADGHDQSSPVKMPRDRLGTMTIQTYTDPRTSKTDTSYYFEQQVLVGQRIVTARCRLTSDDVRVGIKCTDKVIDAQLRKYKQAGLL